MSIASRRSPSRLELLDQIPVVTRVDTAGRRRLLTVFNEVDVAAGSVILHGGEHVDHLHLVGEGVVSATADDGTLLLLGAGEALGLPQLLGRGRLAGSIVAVEDCVVWTMGRREFICACVDVPGFALGVLEAWR